MEAERSRPRLLREASLDFICDKCYSCAQVSVSKAERRECYHSHVHGTATPAGPGPPCKGKQFRTGGKRITARLRKGKLAVFGVPVWIGVQDQGLQIEPSSGNLAQFSPQAELRRLDHYPSSTHRSKDKRKKRWLHLTSEGTCR